MKEKHENPPYMLCHIQCNKTLDPFLSTCSKMIVRMARFSSWFLQLIQSPDITGYVLFMFRIYCINLPICGTFRKQGTKEELGKPYKNITDLNNYSCKSLTHVTLVFLNTQKCIFFAIVPGYDSLIKPLCYFVLELLNSLLHNSY